MDTASPSFGGTAVQPEFTIDQAAKWLRMSTKSVRRLIRLGEIAHHRIGKRILFTNSDLLAHVQRNRHPARQEGTAELATA
jgi:excisionase family DNA binding protein